MIRLREHGVDETFALLDGVARRAGDQSSLWDAIADDLFDFERAWWDERYGTQSDKDKRRGRNPAYMQQTGGLRASSTRRGAPRQRLTVGSDFMLLDVTSGLAAIHENRGREVLGDPSPERIDRWVHETADFILTGRD